MQDVIYIKAQDLNNHLAISPVATIGAGRTERAFYKVAHDTMRRRLLIPSAPPPPTLYICPHLHAILCGLTRYQFACLLAEPNATEWKQIRHSITTQAKEAKT